MTYIPRNKLFGDRIVVVGMPNAFKWRIKWSSPAAETETGQPSVIFLLRDMLESVTFFFFASVNVTRQHIDELQQNLWNQMSEPNTTNTPHVTYLLLKYKKWQACSSVTRLNKVCAIYGGRLKVSFLGLLLTPLRMAV